MRRRIGEGIFGSWGEVNIGEELGVPWQVVDKISHVEVYVAHPNGSGSIIHSMANRTLGRTNRHLDLLAIRIDCIGN